MNGGNRLKLGLFAANCSSGTAMTTVPERWDASWESNLALAQMADGAGIEFMLPIARWRGYGGESDFQGRALETITWACGLLAHTDDITVFGTVHAPLIHPIVAAKQMATVDHISGGRFGLNLVCGWNQDEFDMFGLDQRAHDERYDYGQEWWDIVSGLWAGPEPFDVQGRFFQLAGVRGEPGPAGGKRPIVMNAGASEAGRRFAARNCDALFTPLLDAERAKKDQAAIHALAQSFGRTVQIYTSTHIVCRPSRAEAVEYHRHYAIEHADEVAVDRLMALQGLHAETYPPDVFGQFRTRFAGGHGSFPIIGDADDVARALAEISALGYAGATIAMVNYLDTLPYFVEAVLPRLERLGLRMPKETS